MAHDWKKVAILGVLVALTPLLGVPRSWKDILIVFFGVVLVVLGLVIRVSGAREHSADKETERSNDGHEPARTV